MKISKKKILKKNKGSFFTFDNISDIPASILQCLREHMSTTLSISVKTINGVFQKKEARLLSFWVIYVKPLISQ